MSAVILLCQPVCAGAHVDAAVWSKCQLPLSHGCTTCMPIMYGDHVCLSCMPIMRKLFTIDYVDVGNIKVSLNIVDISQTWPSSVSFALL